MSIAQKSIAVIAVAAISVAVVFSFVSTIKVAEASTLTSAQVQAIVSLLQSFGADSTTIANVQASLNGTAPTGGSGSMMSGSCSFTVDLTIGSKGADVTCLQNALIAAGYSIPAGATGYFGSQTQAAVMKWQAAAGVTPAAGYFGPKSRAAWGSGTIGGTTGTTPVPTGTGLSVAAGVQPVASLAPQGATRVPFTTFTLTAGNDGDVAVSGVTVQRTGLGTDSTFAGVILVDQGTGAQLGVAKTFNSNHQAIIGGSFTVPRGTTRSFLVAGNMNASLSGHSGETPSISVVAVNTTATVSGSLPIVGAAQTTNSTLTVGVLTLSTSNAYAVNTNSSQNIGTTGYKFTGFSLTAGSAEDVRLRSVTWNQTGSVSGSDLANVVTVVNGTSYPAVLSSDGKYYMSTLGSGVVIPKGNRVDVYVQGDIVGSNSSGRTAIFDVDKNTDIFATGETYGYGISPAIGASAPSGTRLNLEVTSGTPYIYAAQISVTGASITTISKDNGTPAQNIAVNVPNQPLGGFVVDLKGESMTVQQMVFNVATTSGANTLTNVTIVDENGAVVAGPVDESSVAASPGTLTFTDTVTFNTGRHVYSLRGKTDSSSTNGGTYILSSTPSSQWTNVKGVSSGNTISLSGQSTFTMNTMTIKSGALSVTISSTPAAQGIVAGAQNFTFANVQLDASQSGEDVRVSSIALTENGSSNALAGAHSLLTSCQLFDGATALNTGSNVVNGDSVATTTTATMTKTFTLDNSMTVTKGTTKTLAVICNLSSSADTSSTFQWGITGAQITALSVTGVGSNATITAAPATTNNGQLMTVSSAGAVVATTDSQSPAYAIAAAGSTGVTLGAYRLSASNEDVNINRIGIQLGTVTASSTAADVTTVYLYNGSTLLGQTSFNGANRHATTTLSTPILVPKDGSVTITVKGDLAVQNASAASLPGALLTVDIDTASTNTQGIGAQSGSTVNATGSTSVAGVRSFRAYPSVARSTVGMSSTLIAQSGIDLYRFTVSASSGSNSNGIALNQVVVNVATSSVSTTNGTTTVNSLKVYAYTGSDFQTGPVAGFTAGQLNTTVTNLVSGNNTVSFTSPLSIPAGATYYFRVVGDVAQVAGTTGSAGSVTTKLTGDTTYPSLSTLLGSASGVSSNFVWSPLSTSSSAQTGSNDWSNGFNVSGISSGSSDSWTLTK